MTNQNPWIDNDVYPKYETVSEACRASDQTMGYYLKQLRANPGRRLAWSCHQSRSAARQRINNLRRTQVFRDNPNIQFETRSVRWGDPDSGVYILIYCDDVTNTN